MPLWSPSNISSSHIATGTLMWCLCQYGDPTLHIHTETVASSHWHSHICPQQTVCTHKHNHIHSPLATPAMHSHGLTFLPPMPTALSSSPMPSTPIHAGPSHGLGSHSMCIGAVCCTEHLYCTALEIWARNGGDLWAKSEV